MSETGKPFIRVGKHLININSIVFVAEIEGGRLKIATSASRKDGNPVYANNSSGRTRFQLHLYSLRLVAYALHISKHWNAAADGLPGGATPNSPERLSF